MIFFFLFFIFFKGIEKERLLTYGAKMASAAFIEIIMVLVD